MDIKQIFEEIEKYHNTLGYHDRDPMTTKRHQERLRQIGLALFVEVGELVDSLPWKPWRAHRDQQYLKDNALREIVDIVFFLVAMCELLDFTAEDFIEKYNYILKHNYIRLAAGYNNPEEIKGGDTSDR